MEEFKIKYQNAYEQIRPIIWKNYMPDMKKDSETEGKCFGRSCVRQQQSVFVFRYCL